MAKGKDKVKDSKGKPKVSIQERQKRKKEKKEKK